MDPISIQQDSQIWNDSEPLRIGRNGKAICENETIYQFEPAYRADAGTIRHEWKLC